MNMGAWWATVHRIAKSRILLLLLRAASVLHQVLQPIPCPSSASCDRSSVGQGSHLCAHSFSGEWGVQPRLGGAAHGRGSWGAPPMGRWTERAACAQAPLGKGVAGLGGPAPRALLAAAPGAPSRAAPSRAGPAGPGALRGGDARSVEQLLPLAAFPQRGRSRSGDAGTRPISEGRGATSEDTAWTAALRSVPVSGKLPGTEGQGGSPVLPTALILASP